jgi:hypothetical protein
MPGPGAADFDIYSCSHTGIRTRGGQRPWDYTAAGQGSRVPSIVSSGICANAAGVPVVLVANMQQENPTMPPSLAISKPAISNTLVFKTDCARDKCGKVLDPSRRTGLPFESCRSEMIFGRDSRSCYSGFSGISAKTFETDDFIEPTLPRKLGYGRDAGG